MLSLLRQTKVREHRLENLLLWETLVFLCLPAGRIKDIMRILRLGAAPDGSLRGLSPKLLCRLEGLLAVAVPGILSVQARLSGQDLALSLSWPDLEASLALRPVPGQLRVDLELRGQGQEVAEIARDAMAL